MLRSLYPGCPFEREVLGLEMVQLVLSEMLPAEDVEVEGHEGTGHGKGALAKVRSCSAERNWGGRIGSLYGIYVAAM